MPSGRRVAEIEPALDDEPLYWDAVREIVDGELDASGARQPFLAGGVTFCGLVPLRTVPFRVVCLLGMNEGEFPRRDRDRAINLIRLKPRLGDSSVRDDDRLLLLQWLLAARDVFYVSYTGQDTSTGEALAPSTAVAELLDFVARNQFAGRDRDQALAALVTRQPMQPFSPRYFAAPTPTAHPPVGAISRSRSPGPDEKSSISTVRPRAVALCDVVRDLEIAPTVDHPPIGESHASRNAY